MLNGSQPIRKPSRRVSIITLSCVRVLCGLVASRGQTPFDRRGDLGKIAYRRDDAITHGRHSCAEIVIAARQFNDVQSPEFPNKWQRIVPRIQPTVGDQDPDAVARAAFPDFGNSGLQPLGHIGAAARPRV